jgi:hypothetical protein
MGGIWRRNVEIWGNMEEIWIWGNVEYGEIWRKCGEKWKYEGMWKYERNMGAILVDNMYTNRCVYLDHRKSKPTLLSRAN